MHSQLPNAKDYGNNPHALPQCPDVRVSWEQPTCIQRGCPQVSSCFFVCKSMTLLLKLVSMAGFYLYCAIQTNKMVYGMADTFDREQTHTHTHHSWSCIGKSSRIVNLGLASPMRRSGLQYICFQISILRTTLQRRLGCCRH